MHENSIFFCVVFRLAAAFRQPVARLYDAAASAGIVAQALSIFDF